MNSFEFYGILLVLGGQPLLPVSGSDADPDKLYLKVAFKVHKEIGHYFNSKGRLTDVLKQSLVIYQIKCKECQASYTREFYYMVKLHVTTQLNN